jgi:hypothetical protein
MADLLRAFEEELQSKNFKGYRYSSGQKKGGLNFLYIEPKMLAQINGDPLVPVDQRFPLRREEHKVIAVA